MFSEEISQMSGHSIVVEPSLERPEATDPRIPRRDRVVTRDILERWNRLQPEKTFLLIESTELATWSYRDAYEHAVQSALGLQNIGVEQDERVLVWLPNSAENARLFLGINFIGAVYVPLNTAYRGQLLSHAIGLSKAKVAIIDATLMPFLEDVPLGTLEKLVVIGDA